MMALSVRQPWASLIVRGYKDIENRSRTTFYRGPLLIHASRTPDLLAASIMPHMSQGQFGGIIGVVTLVDVVTESSSPWFDGPYGWVLADAHVLPFQPWRGALYLFQVDPAQVQGLDQGATFHDEPA